VGALKDIARGALRRKVLAILERPAMNKGVLNLVVVLASAVAISVGCSSSNDDSTSSSGGSGGKNAAGGSGGSAGTSGAGGSAGKGSAGTGGLPGSAGAGGSGEAGPGGAENAGGEGGSAGEASAYSAAMVERGALIVRSLALCGGCHTAASGMELAGNPLFKNSTLPAPNLTPDPTGIGNWTDAQIMNAFRNGIDDGGRHLDPAMPYWLFHNMNDADAMAVVAFLRSLTPVSGAVGAANPDATPVTPVSPSAFPDTTLASTSPDYAAAVQGRYLVSGVAQCVKCHSPSAAGLPSGSFFSGVAPTSGTQVFSPNITPDTTGISGWAAADVATALKLGTNKASVTLCGSMPSAAKGYGGMTDDDAHAIGVYLTTIPAVSNSAANPTLEPACP
jgi:Cytochrome C oxidase, cbb3-type, subunit III